MTRLIVLSDKAKSDIDGIWTFTLETWGLEQAEDYITRISLALHRLADNPLTGSDRSAVKPRYRKLTIGSHAIFCRHDDHTLEIVRVLHARMDAGVLSED